MAGAGLGIVAVGCDSDQQRTPVRVSRIDVAPHTGQRACPSAGLQRGQPPGYRLMACLYTLLYLGALRTPRRSTFLSANSFLSWRSRGRGDGSLFEQCRAKGVISGEIPNADYRHA